MLTKTDGRERVGERSSRLLLPGFGLGLLLCCATLYEFAPALYRSVLELWMLHPFPHPFIDWEYMPAAAECWSKGINVYVDTPCYAPIPAGKFSYSPLWIRLSFLPTGSEATAAFGLFWAVLFFLSLAYLPPPRGRQERVLTLLTLGSSLTAFAVERANVDLIMFLLATAGVALWLARFPLRLAAYAVFTLAGLLKFYPLVLLTLMVRERPRVFFALACAAAAVLALFTAAFRSELVAALSNLPRGSYFADLFAAVNLPFGLPKLLSYLAAKVGATSLPDAMLRWLPPLVLAALVIEVLAVSIWLALFAGMRPAMEAISPRSRALLVAGAVLVCGCFFAGQSVGYRGILLLLVLPGLFRLRPLLPALPARTVAVATYAIVFVAWVLTIQYLLVRMGLTRVYDADYDGPGLLHWFVHELAWWWIIGVLLATLFAFVADSVMGRWVVQLLSWRSTTGSSERPRTPVL